MMHDEPQAVTITRLEIAVERLIAFAQLQEEVMNAVLDLLFEEEGVANLERRVDIGILEAIREVYKNPGRYAPQVAAGATPQPEEEEEHVNEN